MKRRNVRLRDERFVGYKQELSFGQGEGGGEWRVAPGGMAQKAEKWGENVDFKF